MNERKSLFPSLRQALKALRGDRSQTEMAALCDKTQTWWSYLESGTRNPRLPDLLILSRIGLSLVGGQWKVDTAAPRFFDPTDTRNALAAEKKLLDLLSFVPGWAVMRSDEVDRILNECEALRIERDAARAAVREYIDACIFEADESAVEGAECLFGPRSRAAKKRVTAAYERLSEIARAA